MANQPPTRSILWHRPPGPRPAGCDGVGTGLTLQIGAIAGAIGLGVGIVLGFVGLLWRYSGYRHHIVYRCVHEYPGFPDLI
jgi:hypothetical protein